MPTRGAIHGPLGMLRVVAEEGLFRIEAVFRRERWRHLGSSVTTLGRPARCAPPAVVCTRLILQDFASARPSKHRVINLP
jgi:hypothetical protein